MYRLGDGAKADGWPFLNARHAYLADGTPLTEYDRNGKIVPSRWALQGLEKVCAGGQLCLADRRRGLEALARALDAGDVARAPILLVQLQIDPVPDLSKSNPWHKPPGPGGGQFAAGPEAGSPAEAGSDFQNIAQTMHVGMTSTYVPGVYGPDIDIAHNFVMALVQRAILQVSTPAFRPGMPGYGLEPHKALAAEIEGLQGVSLYSEQAYLMGAPVAGRPLGSSAPDVVYGPIGGPLVVWELKTGRAATDISAAEIAAQRARTLVNVPGQPLYEYIQIYEE